MGPYTIPHKRPIACRPGDKSPSPLSSMAAATERSAHKRHRIKDQQSSAKGQGKNKKSQSQTPTKSTTETIGKKQAGENTNTRKGKDFNFATCFITCGRNNAELDDTIVDGISGRQAIRALYDALPKTAKKIPVKQLRPIQATYSHDGAELCALSLHPDGPCKDRYVYWFGSFIVH